MTKKPLDWSTNVAKQRPSAKKWLRGQLGKIGQLGRFALILLIFETPTKIYVILPKLCVIFRNICTICGHNLCVIATSGGPRTI